MTPIEWWVVALTAIGTVALLVAEARDARRERERRHARIERMARDTSVSDELKRNLRRDRKS